jgi:hypothetical protein
MFSHVKTVQPYRGKTNSIPVSRTGIIAPQIWYLSLPTEFCAQNMPNRAMAQSHTCRGRSDFMIGQSPRNLGLASVPGSGPKSCTAADLPLRALW